MSLSQILQRHPFAVEAWFDRVVAVSFAFPEAVIRPLVPTGLEIDTHEGFGFVTVSLVWAKNLRPAGFPDWLSQDFFLAGYRVFTRLNDGGRRLRGLRILRSETDQRRMVWAGNLVTGYNYRHVRVNLDHTAPLTRVRTCRLDGNATLDVTFDSSAPAEALPPGSPFNDWKTARRFAGPMPFTFSPEGGRTFVVIEGSRQDWVPRPIAVRDWDVGLFREPPLRDTKPILANAFAVEGVAYRWEKGRVVRVDESP